MKSLAKHAQLIGGRAGTQTLVPCSQSLRFYLSAVPCPALSPLTLRAPSSLPPHTLYPLPPASVYPTRPPPPPAFQPGAASVAVIRWLERCPGPQRSPCLPGGSPARPGPFWLATSCCRETLSSIFLTTRWPPFPPLNKLHRSNGWSMTKACTG